MAIANSTSQNSFHFIGITCLGILAGALNLYLSQPEGLWPIVYLAGRIAVVFSVAFFLVSKAKCSRKKALIGTCFVQWMEQVPIKMAFLVGSVGNANGALQDIPRSTLFQGLLGGFLFSLPVLLFVGWLGIELGSRWIRSLLVVFAISSTQANFVFATASRDYDPTDPCSIVAVKRALAEQVADLEQVTQANVHKRKFSLNFAWKISPQEYAIAISVGPILKEDGTPEPSLEEGSEYRVKIKPVSARKCEVTSIKRIRRMRFIPPPPPMPSFR